MNEPFVLGWRTEGATRIELFTEAGPVPSASETMLAGELSDLRIAEDTEFVLRAHDGLGGYVEERLTVSVGAPEIEALEFAPAFVEPGGTVELSWAVLGDPQGAEVSLSLTDGEGGEYDLSGKSVVEDRLTLTLERPGIHSFTLKAWSEIGEDERTAEVVVDDTPSVTLTASTAEYDGREPVTLSWTSRNARGGLWLYEVLEGGERQLVYEVPADERASGSYEVEPERDATYVIVADNGLGLTAEAKVEVGIGLPAILRFEAEPEEVFWGEEVTLSWDVRLASEVRLGISAGEQRIAIEVEGMPLEDISFTGTPLSLTYCEEQVPGWEYPPGDEGCGLIEFPEGFVFPFGGVDQKQILVYSNGALSFDFFNLRFTYNVEASFPNGSPIHIAPFWSDLDGSHVWYEFATDERGQFLVVQWRAHLYGWDSSLEFQAVLWEDGTFAFRYGAMDGLGYEEVQRYADGGYALIGYQTPEGGRWWHNLHVGFDGGTPVPVEGGLSQRSWHYGFVLPVPPAGHHAFRPGGATTVELVAIGPKGETRATLDVAVRMPVELEASVDPSVVAPGEPVTLSWTVTPNVEWTPTVYLPMREVDSPFVDISTRPNVVDLFEAGADDSITWFSFAEGFLFPWGGELHSGVAVSSDGFLSFDPAAWPYHWNGPLPDRVRGEVHLAPFWDDIRAPGGGRILAAVLEDGSHVIQWSKMDRNSRGADLNFQVVLFPDGAIEYRYGTMAPGCIDEVCWLEANGSSATIGYQNPSGSVWYVLHYGADAVAFPGGLENRSFRMDAGVAGSVTLHPTATGVYPVCAEVAGYRTCEVLEVGVLSP